MQYLWSDTFIQFIAVELNSDVSSSSLMLQEIF